MKKRLKKKTVKTTYYGRSPLLRYVALAIFAALPFIGFLIGYWLS